MLCSQEKEVIALNSTPFYRHVLKAMLVLALLISTGYLTGNPTKQLNQQWAAGAIRTDRQPLDDRLPALAGFEACYWQGGAYSSPSRFSVGPTDYWIRGFMVLSEDQCQRFVKAYMWQNANPVFPEGLDPTITHRDSFSWKADMTFTETILNESGCLGQLYFDAAGRVLFFNLSTY